LRHGGMRQLVRLLSELGPLRDGLDEDSATDIMFLLFSPNLYSAAVGGRGWTPERWETWTTQVLAETLL
jgi:hypothetical protein